MRFPNQVFAPTPANCSRHAIETFAQSVAERFGFVPDRDAAESPRMRGKVRFERIQDLIRKIGVHIDFEYVPAAELHTSQSLIVFSEERFEIALLGRYRMEEKDQNWILAQELGHRLLHYPLVVQQHGHTAMAVKRYPDDADPIARQARREALWFAFGFLTPAKAFMDAYRATTRPDALEYRFNVPRRVIELRYQYLSELKASG
ncbi:ImmA/IrrE family metallo-endopeptidase [Microvirga sp. BT688]|uniref:ImmA/IrrE family metallo-endopeptidase n=1 Tax=Microvirga sp. TaxID=1873136 RepID=UPI0016847021|nr:ImmA/IrrE family metallo-endopeptidase [Microvirga sp.]MBD2745926.1 ImmA/IrrE family metallo-endopeptidase [Microvirga sp.]